MNDEAPSLWEGLGAAALEPEVRRQRALRFVERCFSAAESWLRRWLPEELDPLVQSGAIANTCFIVACVSGILLLIWYRSSVHYAYDSVAAMAPSVAARLVRGLHRYSSDAAMLFVLLHATRLFAARRFGGARWFAWITGVCVLFLLWLVGWLGYWLVWDQRGHAVALATARLLDALPLFPDLLSRSFIADRTLSSLLFFVVFFVHMLLPLAMAAGLWLHIARLSRPRFLTNRALTLWVLAALVLLALLAPPDLAPPARMASLPHELRLDAWFLLPIALGERLHASAAWALLVLGAAALLSLPWVLFRGRAAPAQVIEARCNGCEKCYRDCPYDAIRMLPRASGRTQARLAVVSADKCVSCGICAGSCDSAGIGLPQFDAIQQRHRLDALLERATAAGESAPLALTCARSAGAGLKLDEPSAASPDLPGFRVLRVPCAGWIHPLLIERALRRGAPRVVVVACGPGSCCYREGEIWTQARMAGEREPKLRLDRVGTRLQVLSLFPHQTKQLIERALAPDPAARSRRARGARRLVAALALAASFAATTWAGVRVRHASAASPEPQLSLSLKAAGHVEAACRPLTEEEKRSRPVHMRATQVCERRRADVTLAVAIDGRPVLHRAYPAGGLWGDGQSVALEHLTVPRGSHLVRIEIHEGPGAEFRHVSERRVEFRPHQRVVVLFDPAHRFSWL